MREYFYLVLLVILLKVTKYCVHVFHEGKKGDEDERETKGQSELREGEEERGDGFQRTRKQKYCSEQL